MRKKERLTQVADELYARADDVSRVVSGIGLLLIGLGLVGFVLWACGLF